MTAPPKIALAGAGWIAAVHALAAKERGLTVTHVASRHREKATELAARAGALACGYDDLPGEADVVVVCSAPQCHAAHVQQAVRAGARVIVEKPLCTTLADADMLVANRDPIGYAENLAYAPIVQRFLEEVGEIGALRHLEVRAVQGRPTWGDFLTKEWGGGALFDLGVHPVAVAMLAADEAPVAVSAHLEGADDHPTDEHAEVALTFASGLRARIVSSWRGGAVPQWDAQAASDTETVRAELLPALLLERDGEPLGLPTTTAAVPQLEQYGYTEQLDAFLVAFGGRSAPLMDARFGRAVLDVVCGAYASARDSGSEVGLPFTGPRDRTPLELWRG